MMVRYHIFNVVSADEYAENVTDSVYTNAVCQAALQVDYCCFNVSSLTNAIYGRLMLLKVD